MSDEAGAGRRPPVEPCPLRRAVTAALTSLLVVLALPAGPAAAASTAKVVIVVGPVGSSNAHYKADAEAIAVEARKYTSNVIKLASPMATWTRVKAAAQGASVLVYLGHGNGWPSTYAPFQAQTKDGLGLDPSTGADGTKTVYYGEDYIRANIRLAPNAVVLLYHLCYASGNTEPGLAPGTFTNARERVDNYGAGFIDAGARAVFAEGHPSHPATDYVRQLFTTNRTMDQVFRAAPSRHGNAIGPYASQRTPGLRFRMDPDTATPSGFYRSVIGDLALTAGTVTGPAPVPTGTTPPDFVFPGAAEVAGLAGTGLFRSAEAAADPVGAASSTLAKGTRLRLATEGTAMPDGTRVFGVSVLGGSVSGFVRATELAPRDSVAPEIWTLDQSPDWLSPNGDGKNDGLVVAARISETVTTGLQVRNAGGASVWSGSVTGDTARFAWNLRTKAGALVPDGAYTWTMKSRDTWGNPTVTRTGAFTVDGRAPVTTASTATTTGPDGWITTTPLVTLTATDALSGVGSINWRLDGGTVRTYTAPVPVTVNGTPKLEYRSVDRAGIVEAWHSLTLKIDTVPPEIAIPVVGTAGATEGTWLGPVKVSPAITDATSGVRTKTISVDGADPVSLGKAAVAVAGEGEHTVSVTATDVAGNAATTSRTFVIDTVAPVVELLALAAEGSSIPTVTPNGDKAGESIAIPYSVSESAAVTAVFADGTGVVVRTITGKVEAGAREAAWDGRTAKGVAVPDGRYTVTLTGTDPAGNASSPVVAPVDVYAALSAISRTPALFFPQDGDALAAKSTVRFTLLAPARVSLDVVDGKGTVVRTAWADRDFEAGSQSWSWNGKRADGTRAPRGTYRFLVRATNGEQAAAGAATTIADAFRTVTSTTSPARGAAFTITVVTAERLATTPRITVRQPGVSTWSVTMTKVSSTTWTTTIRPRKGGTAGPMSLTVQAKDTEGGTNAKVVRLSLR